MKTHSNWPLVLIAGMVATGCAGSLNSLQKGELCSYEEKGFLVEEKDCSPARSLEPYMGMAAHAEVVCIDLSVFAHIHPAGSVSMASLDIAQAGLMAESSAAGSGMVMESAHSLGSLPPKISFPY